MSADGFEVELVHPYCSECQEHVRPAIAVATVTGSRGAIHSDGPHGATVARLDLPPVGSIVQFQDGGPFDARYRVTAHGCPTYGDRCPHPEYAISALQLNRRGRVQFTTTQCLDGRLYNAIEGLS